ncbi:hypothetical protein [Lactiplantibacillus mudanjiangensis]|uniref:ABC transporter permease [Lactobacillus sp.] n=1 Tax=Lactiplantibacillus mudanjiangensis TaxID=1296538 RepID=A0A660DVF6_9LACO|nr:hypothetical protein [Lactiplantibacillus mudanjiangensis]VDG18851.1 ABC transporter permease [Lactobacillus sp.] [Lactiplantibacillus mudanjiangensis]VDG25370.1 ABC transporter permease [Lactobacillus sp.] [Lactiplantibacillus mudanjiangensis]VDG27599.1 ABC transporter permease [Lactobacillus sp.] [Lactiplantibacillus mudanjiangensis]VDG32950.1 ABC transporter permease [Lactobacillus sp.] [Lactiplantibacillus mudanjiangensis]
MPTKLRTTTHYLFTEQLRLLGWTYVYLIAIFLILPFIFDLISGNLKDFSLTGSIATLGLGAVFGLFLMITMSLTYDHFKLFIQNGISRKTFWRARILSMLAMGLVGTIITAIYDYAIVVPLRFDSIAKFFNNGNFYTLYIHYFGNNLAINIFASLIMLLLAYILLGTTGLAFGSIFSLLSKTTRRLVLILGPILGIFFLFFIASNSNGHSSDSFIWLLDLFKFLVGDFNNAAAGHLNPLMPMLTMLVGSSIMAGIAYFFNQKLKVKS